mgnify:FL=1
MPLKTPKFWSGLNWQSILLFPLSYIWRLGHYINQKNAQPQKSDIPVICVGNLTVGGSGKTPVVITLCRFLSGIGKSPSVLTRGFGGRKKGPVFVNSNLHESEDVGDEPLMMSNSNTVCVSRNRPAGAAFISSDKELDCVVMDDGLQNPTLEKNLKIAVFDGKFGIGNGLLLPAGPMRETLDDGLKNVDMVIFNGEDETGLTQKIPSHIPIFTGELRPDDEIIEHLKGRPVYGFAGIGNPSRFFKTLQNIGADIVGETHFADHHPYTDTDMSQLYEDANQAGSELVTTQKDWMRLPAEWRERVLTVPVRIHFSSADSIKIVSLLETTFKNVLSSQ